MRLIPDAVRVAMPCTGLGRQHRGFEAFTRDLYAALNGTRGITMSVFGGGGSLLPHERAVWNLPRTSVAARAVSRLARRGPYFVEQMTFFAGVLPHLLSWRPHLVYFADLNFGNACWHWRRLTGQRFRLLYYNGGPTTRPYTRCDWAQQMTPAHFASAIKRGESREHMFVLPHAFNVGNVPSAGDPVRIAAVRQSFGVPAGRRMLLSVGILGSTLKRMDALVDAVAAMGDDRPYLVILGQETEETLALRTRALMLGGGVWIGTWPKERMTDAYAAADAFALLSLDEGFGLAYVEAMAAGLPCVVHDNPNTRYILGNHAFLGDTTNEAETVALLRRALHEDPSEALRTARHAWVRGRFSWDVLAPKYAEMLRACALGRRPAWNDE